MISKNVCNPVICVSPVHSSTDIGGLTTHEVIPKANSIFTFSVPLYAVSLPTEDVSSVENSIAGSSTQVNVTSTPPPNVTVLDLPHLDFELYGNQFCFRSADRASRKFKHKETIEL
jgi:ribonuclease P protein subunit POP4